jgi:Uma2 family endonuclease
MPTLSHQRIVAFLYSRLLAFVGQFLTGAEVLFAPLKVRLWSGKYREPDVIVMLAGHADRLHEQYMDAPDLVIEILSPDNRHLDLETKRREYARARIPEYWIVDPEKAVITVLTLQDDRYTEAGVYDEHTVARSSLLSGFEVAVGEVWAAAKK